jgi:hypothetical protein
MLDTLVACCHAMRQLVRRGIRADSPTGLIAVVEHLLPSDLRDSEVFHSLRGIRERSAAT